MDDGGVVIFLGAGKVGFRLGWGKPVQIRIQLGHNNYIRTLHELEPKPDLSCSCLGSDLADWALAFCVNNFVFKKNNNNNFDLFKGFLN